ncbi:MAG: type II toxin-antitoxin system VapC family toxin [Vicinamibacteria bacterium]
MIVLDTNVVSELMKPEPAGEVLSWMGGAPAASFYTTSITQAEILHGILLLPAGRRRRAIEATATAMFREDFPGRVLAFDEDSAPPYAQIATERRKAGRPISQFDAQIAAIARSRKAVLATRNVSDFEGCGIEIINPWRTKSTP